MKLKLFGFEIAWASAAFGAVLPQHASLPHGIDRMDPAQFFADTLAAAPLEQSIGLRAALWLVALAPLWILRRPVTIAGLAGGDRERVLERLVTSPVYAIRQLAALIKALATMLYASSAEARIAMTMPVSAPRYVVLRVRGDTQPLFTPEITHAHSAALFE